LRRVETLRIKEKCNLGNDTFKETNRVEPQESLRKITVQVQETQNPTL
jgi:hypothetical protein